MKAIMAFDTLAYANKLKAAGVSSEIAEAHASANLKMIESLVDTTLATKSDLAKMESHLKHQIGEVKFELKQDIKDLENRLTLRVGAIVAGSFGIFTALSSFLHLMH